MLTFPNVTPAAFALVLDQLRKEGSSVIGPHGPAFNSQAVTAGQTETMWPVQYTITGEHFPLGKITANVSYDGSTVHVDVVKPKAWEHAIGSKLQDAISDAKRQVTGESA